MQPPCLLLPQEENGSKINASSILLILASGIYYKNTLNNYKFKELSKKMSDVKRLQDAFVDIESAAKLLPWADENPWKVRTHVGLENNVPIIDLHGLSSKLGKKLLRLLIRTASRLETGACIIITGQGTHSIGEPTLRKIAISVLGQAAIDNGWGFHTRGAGRLVLVTDVNKAPIHATGKLGKVFWWSATVFFVLLFFFMFRSCYI